MLDALEENKVDKEEGKSLIDSEHANAASHIESPEFLEVTVDSEDKVLEGLKQDGTKVIGGDLSVGGSANITENLTIGSQFNINGTLYNPTTSPEYLQVTTDSDNKILEAIKTDGTKVIGGDLQVNGNIINDGIQKTLDTAIEEMQEEVNEMLEDSLEVLSCLDVIDNPEFIQVTTDSKDKILEGIKTDGTKVIATDTQIGGDATILGKVDIQGVTYTLQENPEWISGTTDAEGKILSYRDENGVLHEEAGIVANKLKLSESGNKELKEALQIEDNCQSEDVAYCGKYYGNPINILEGKVLSLIDYKELSSSSSNVQAACLYRDTLIICDASEDWRVYNIKSGLEIGRISKPVDIHFNTAIFAPTLHDGNNDFPYLYVSAWNLHGQNGIYVFDLSLAGEQYILNTVQIIDFSEVSDSIVGVGRNDFAIDFERNILYYIGYLLESYTDGTDNAKTFAAMKLPVVASGNISIQDSDIISHWRCPFYPVTQNCLYVDGKIFILAGYPAAYKKLIIVDVATRSYTNVLNLDDVLGKNEEPEGLLLRKGDLLMTTQVGKVYKVAFENHDKEGIEKIGDGVLEGNVCIDYYNPYSDLDMENMLKLKGNLHGHTTYSDSEITPENYMKKYRDAGYDFAAFTDHDNYENGHLVPEYADHIAPDPEVEGIIYMGPCYEDTSTTQHINIYQIPEFLGFKGSRTANEVFRKGSLEKGRLCCLNHPNWGSQFLSNDYILKMEKIFNFVELWNGSIGTTESSTEKGNSWAGACRAWDILLSSGHKVFGLAVDDYHLLPNHPENLMFRRGYVEVYSKGRTARDIYRALAQGRFVACNALGTDNSIEITKIDCSDGKYHVELAEACDIYFFGVNGTILQENLDVMSATYILNGTEKYVRCAIKKEYEYKWLQPLIRKSVKRTFNL